MSFVVCAGIGLAGWFTLSAPAENYPAAFAPYRPLALFLYVGLALVPAYIAARAVDRLTQ
jgi:hypothetical protein